MPNKHYFSTIIISAFLLFFTSTISLCADKTPATSIAFVDVSAVFKAHPLETKWEKEVESLRSQKEKEIAKAIQQKYSVKSEKDLTASQKKEVHDYLVQENQKFVDEMTPKKEENQKIIEKDILSACTQIANDKGYDVILDRSAVIVGGTDITNDVQKLVSAKYK